MPRELDAGRRRVDRHPRLRARVHAHVVAGGREAGNRVLPVEAHRLRACSPDGEAHGRDRAARRRRAGVRHQLLEDRRDRSTAGRGVEPELDVRAGADPDYAGADLADLLAGLDLRADGHGVRAGVAVVERLARERARGHLEHGSVGPEPWEALPDDHPGTDRVLGRARRRGDIDPRVIAPGPRQHLAGRQRQRHQLAAAASGRGAARTARGGRGQRHG